MNWLPAHTPLATLTSLYSGSLSIGSATFAAERDHAAKLKRTHPPNAETHRMRPLTSKILVAVSMPIWQSFHHAASEGSRTHAHNEIACGNHRPRFVEMREQADDDSPKSLDDQSVGAPKRKKRL